MSLQYIHFLTMLTLAVSFFCCGFFVKKQWRLIQLVVLLNIVAEFAANYCWYVLQHNNALVYNIVSGYNFIIWILFLKPKHTYLITALFAVVFSLNLFFLQGANAFNSLTFLVGTFIVCITILHYYYKNFVILQNDVHISMYKIILLMAIFLYHVGFATILFTNVWGATKIYLFPKMSVHSIVASIINTIFYGALMASMLLYKNKRVKKLLAFNQIIFNTLYINFCKF